jgi:hypothetical protein
MRMGVAHTALKQHSDDYCLKLLRQVELDRAGVLSLDL